jgi:pimeloyl-ACP methyl ester carboxylesterase
MSSDRIVTAAGFRLHVREEGSAGAPPILLTHGFSHSLETWDAWAADLAADYRVIRFDLPGHGRSGPDARERYSNEDTVDALAGLIEALELKRPVLAGNSLGGLVAWRYAARPDSVARGLILLAPGGFSINGVSERPLVVPHAVEAYLQFAPAPAVRDATRRLYGDPGRLAEHRVASVHAAMTAKGVGQALVKRLSLFTLPNPAADLARVRAPALLLWGGRDVMIPVDHADRFAAALPDVRKIVYDGLGHMPHEEAPDVTLADVRAFLKTLPR